MQNTRQSKFTYRTTVTGAASLKPNPLHVGKLGYRLTYACSPSLQNTLQMVCLRKRHECIYACHDDHLNTLTNAFTRVAWLPSFYASFHRQDLFDRLHHEPVRIEMVYISGDDFFNRRGVGYWSIPPVSNGTFATTLTSHIKSADQMLRASARNKTKCVIIGDKIAKAKINIVPTSTEHKTQLKKMLIMKWGEASESNVVASDGIWKEKNGAKETLEEAGCWKNEAKTSQISKSSDYGTWLYPNESNIIRISAYYHLNIPTRLKQSQI